LLLRTVQVYCLPSGATIASVREQFVVCGGVRTVRMPQGSPGDAPGTNGLFAEVEFESAEAAFAACDTLTDTQNWRGGLRVTLRENISVAAARRLLAKSGSSKKKEPNQKEANGAVGAALERSGHEEGQAEAPLEGRQTGVVRNLKGPYGFISPDNVPGGRAKTADDNLYFKTKHLAELVQGSAVAYDTAVVNGKVNAVNVAVLAGVDEPSDGGTADAAAHRHAKPPRAYQPRPESFRPKLQAKQVRMAAGPDGTLGFAEGWRRASVAHGFGGLKKSTSSSGFFSASAAE
jgi:hypothetical protein